MSHKISCKSLEFIHTMVTLLLKLLRELVSINKSCPKPPFIHIKKKKQKKKHYNSVKVKVQGGSTTDIYQ